MASVTLGRLRGELAREGSFRVLAIAAKIPFRWFRAYRELSKDSTLDTSEELLAYTRALASGWFNPYQIGSEICALLDRVRDLRPKIIVEIGTANGGTLFMFARVAAPDAQIVSIDLPGGDFGGGYPGWRAPLYRHFALAGQQLFLLRGNSHDPSMLDALGEILDGRPIDFLFLDGDHSYQGVKQDHETYSRLVRPGGLVALHDIHPTSDAAIQVPQYWQEIRGAVKGVEWVGSADQIGYGIGMYEVGSR